MGKCDPTCPSEGELSRRGWRRFFGPTPAQGHCARGHLHPCWRGAVFYGQKRRLHLCREDDKARWNYLHSHRGFHVRKAGRDIPLGRH